MADSTATELRALLETAAEHADGASVDERVADIYASVEYRPFWSEPSLARLTRALAALDRDGLTPTHYMVDTLE